MRNGVVHVLLRQICVQITNIVVIDLEIIVTILMLIYSFSNGSSSIMGGSVIDFFLAHGWWTPSINRGGAPVQVKL
jgi:hypothetical protein